MTSNAAISATRALVLSAPTTGAAAKARYALGRGPDVVRAARLILGLERVTAALSDSAEAALIRRHLGRRVLHVLPTSVLGASVLDVPADPEDYLRGRHRQAVRTSVRKAEELGITITRDSRGSRDRVLRLGGLDGTLDAEQTRVFHEVGLCSVWMSARLQGRVLAQTIVAVDGEWAMLAWARREAGESPEASAARYLLHAELVTELSRRGVRFLVDNVQPWRLPEGTFYFEGRLGYHPRSVHLTRAGTTASLPKRLKALVVARLEPGIVDTADHEAVASDNPDDLHYVPSQLRWFYRGLDRRSVQATDVFLDLGCGKGRIVYAAARLPFARVIGVELSEHLAQQARDNLARNSDHVRSAAVEVVQADVRTYAIPDDVTHVYLYNPFLGDTFDVAMAALVASLDRRPRTMTVLYANPVMQDHVIATGRFREAKRHLDPRRRHDLESQVVVYVST